MNVLKSVLCLLLIPLILVGCNFPISQATQTAFSSTSTQPIPIRMATSTPIEPSSTPPDPTPISTLTSTPVPPVEVSYNLKYQIVASLDYPTGSMRIIQNITYTNITGDPITSLPLYAEINRYQDSLSIALLDVADYAESGYLLNNNVLILSFQSDPVQPGETLRITIEYSYQLPEMHSDQGNGLFGRSLYQTNLIDWYFWLAPYTSEEGWLIHPSAGFAEHTVYPLADFDCHLTVINPPENLVVTGSSDPVITSNTYHFSHPNARNLFVSMSPYFKLVELTDENGTIHSYYFPGNEPAATIVLNKSYQALQIYGKTISPYPHPVLNIIETNLIDGLEGDGMYFLGNAFYDNSATNRSLLTLLAVHETAHQWWYAAVSNDQAMEPWLDEAFSTFMESVYYENSSPEDLTWWKSYRLSGNPSTEFVNRTIYDFNFFRPYRNAVYLRGANFLWDLRSAMGDDLFFTFLADYFQNAKAVPISNTTLFFETLSDYFDIAQTDLLGEYFLVDNPQQ